MTQQLHDASLATLRDRYARISTVADVSRELESISVCSTTGIITIMD